MPTTVIEDRFCAWLKALPAVAEQAGGRVYPFGEVPQQTDWPFLTYWRVSGRRMWCLRRPSGVSHPVIQVGCHAQTYRDAKRLADAVRLAIDGFGRGDLGGVTVQTMRVGEDRDYGLTDDDHLGPPHGDEVAQPCVSFDVTIWFEEG